MRLNLLCGIQKEVESKLGWACVQASASIARCGRDLSKPTALLRSNLRFSTQWSIIFNVQVGHLTKYLVGHIETVR